MFYSLFHINYSKEMILLSLIISFVITLIALKWSQNYLPHDLGRKFAFNGKLSKGKPRGAGLVFISIFFIISMLFSPVYQEFIIYFVLLFVCMLSGFFDDKSYKPWGEYKKGFVDLFIALSIALTFLNFNVDSIGFFWADKFIYIPTKVA